LKIAAVFFLAIDAEPLVQRFDQERFPYCVIHNLSERSFNYVAVDLEKGAFQAVAHLTELGHKRIALISGTKDSVWFKGRYAGYCGALANAGIRYDGRLVKDSSMSTIDDDVLRQFVDELLGLPQPPTAFFVTSDRWALRVMDILKSRGVNMPDEISVVGFDDYVESKVYDPPLTTVRQPFYELGAQAFSLIKNLLGDPSRQKVRIIDPSLIMRKSTAPCPVQAKRATRSKRDER